MSDQILEILAELEHDQWVGWSKAVASQVSTEQRARWTKLWVPYSELSEEHKESDRKFARLALAAMQCRPSSPEEKEDTSKWLTCQRTSGARYNPETNDRCPFCYPRILDSDDFLPEYETIGPLEHAPDERRVLVRGRMLGGRRFRR